MEAGADMAGFVLFPASPRYVSPPRAAELAALARGRTEICALIVDFDDQAIGEIVETLKPDWLQLHGTESIARTKAVRRHFGVKVMKAVGIREKADLSLAYSFADCADRLLLDAKPPAGADRPGGHGMSFAWRLLADFDPKGGFLLSGGLNADNVGAALAASHAIGVDVSSGVESEPGNKSVEKIHAFVCAARQAEAVRAKGLAKASPLQAAHS